MGPQLDSCGRAEQRHDADQTQPKASMGPQLDSCGRLVVAVVYGGRYLQLQWGRNLIVAEGAGPAMALPGDVPASMGPQLDSCGRPP